MNWRGTTPLRSWGSFRPPTGASPTGQELGKELSVRVTPRLVTNSGDAAVGYAIQGGGLALALSYQVRDAIAGGELTEVLAPFSLPPLPIQAVYPSSRLISNKVRAFVDMLDKSADWRFSP